MNAFTQIFLVLVGAVLLVSVLWRFASRRQALPCPVWLRWLVELDNPFTKTNRSAVIIEHLALQQGMVVLDVGCGPGRLALPIAKEVGAQGEVVAVDIQPGMLQRVHEKARAMNIANIRTIQAAVGDGKLERNRFDKALLVTVLGEIPDRAAALREIYHALKPGGILSVTEVIFDPHFQRQRTVAQLARAAGFREKMRVGNRFAFTLHLEKPLDIARS